MPGVGGGLTPTRARQRVGSNFTRETEKREAGRKGWWRTVKVVVARALPRRKWTPSSTPEWGPAAQRSPRVWRRSSSSATSCACAWNTFVHRLKLQLTAVALVVSVLYLIQVLPMKLDNRSPRDEDSDANSSTEWSGACRFIIFLLQYGNWVMLLIIFWLVIYLCRLAWKIGQPVPDQREMQNFQNRQKLFEIVGTVSTFAVPLLVVWMPFVGGYYGVNDHKWCDIIVRVTCNSTNKDHEGIGYLLGTWYVPAVLVTLASTVGAIIAISLFWRHYKRKGLTHQMRQAVVKGIGPITYLILFNIISVIDSTNLIYHGVTPRHRWNGTVDYHLWLVHAAMGPGRAMAIPFGFVVTQFFTECCIRKRRDTYMTLN